MSSSGVGHMANAHRSRHGLALCARAFDAFEHPHWQNPWIATVSSSFSPSEIIISQGSMLSCYNPDPPSLSYNISLITLANAYAVARQILRIPVFTY